VFKTSNFNTFQKVVYRSHFQKKNRGTKREEWKRLVGEFMLVLRGRVLEGDVVYDVGDAEVVFAVT